MFRHLDKLEVQIIRLGVFLIFVVTFGDYVVKKVWSVVKPLFP
jgi:hypothetical protein